MGNPVYDVQRSFRNGQNFNDTDGIIANSYLTGVNVRPFGDDLLPRFPNKYIDLTIEEGVKGQLTFEQIFERGNPQALIPFQLGDSLFLIIIINGTWFRVNVRTCTVDIINYELGESPLSPNIQFVNWEVIDRAIVVFDDDLPLIFSGNCIRRANYDALNIFLDAEDNEVVQAVPEAIRSFIGAFDNLRLWLGIGANVLAASDARGVTPNAPLSFASSFTADGDFTSQFPSLTNTTSFSKITAMKTVISQNPNFTGNLLVSTKDQVYFVKSTIFDRNQWETTPGFITQILDDTGVAGNLALENFGYDTLYSDKLGQLNSLFLAQENLQRWSETNISTEVSNYIRAVDPLLYKYTSVVNFSNIALQTSSPYYTTRINNFEEPLNSFAFGGFLVLSKENLSGLNQPARPVWAGLWEGINPIFSVVLNDRLYTLADDNGVNALYETTNSIGNDVYKNDERLIRSRVVLSNFKFQDGGIQDKDFKSLDFSLSNIESDLTVLAEFKASESEKWVKVGCRQFEKSFCLKPDRDDIVSDKGGFLKNYLFRSPTETCQNDYRFRSADIRLTLQGLWRLRDLRLRAEGLQDIKNLERNDDNITPSDCCIEIDDYDIYRTFDSIINSEFERIHLQCEDSCGEEI